MPLPFAQLFIGFGIKCGESARTDLRRGCRVTHIPTAITITLAEGCPWGVK